MPFVSVKALKWRSVNQGYRMIQSSHWHFHCHESWIMKWNCERWHSLALVARVETLAEERERGLENLFLAVLERIGIFGCHIVLICNYWFAMLIQFNSCGQSVPHAVICNIMQLPQLWLTVASTLLSWRCVARGSFHASAETWARLAWRVWRAGVWRDFPTRARCRITILTHLLCGRRTGEKERKSSEWNVPKAILF